MRKTTEQFIIDAWYKHGDRYNYRLVEYKGYKNTVKIICPVHGVFKQRPDHHKNGSGCPECSNISRSIKKSTTIDDYKRKAEIVHDGFYDYSLVDYKGNNTKVKIICPDHGVFEQEANSHLQGHGCPVCSGNRKRTTEQFIIDAWCKHGDRYNYKLVGYTNGGVKVKIICPVHGIFEQRPNNHLTGSGCNECGCDVSANKQRLSKNTLIERAIKKHNGKYKYLDFTYTNTKSKIKAICPVHGVFEQIYEGHVYRGDGCPKCSPNISKQEIEVQDWLSQYIEIETNIRNIISPFELDIIIPSKKIAIEYNGLYWHSEQKGKDKRYHLNKYNLCKEKGYRLIQIWENEWLFKKDIVKSIILNAIGKHTDKIHGRKCEIRVVAPKEARPFYNDNHIQGFKGGEHHGLYYKGNLVSLLTIDKRRELQRFVNKRNTIVHGAFSKLLKSFDCKDIYTFADLRYFTGDVYRNNGFEEIYLTKPNYYYFDKQLDVYHRRNFQKKMLQSKYNKGLLDYFDTSESEYVNMISNGYDRIWDCGNLKFILKENI